LAAISHDPREITASFAERKGITYPLLSDIGSVVIREYGLLNTQIPPDHEWYGIPFPGTFILDPEGRVTARYFEESYRVRSTGQGLALRLGAGTGAAPDSAITVSNDQVEARIYSTDPVVALGQQFLITLDVTVKPGVHLYAPGEHAYKALRFTLDSDSLFAVGNPVYPEAEDYYFAPLDEHVPVFAGSFRILVPVSVAVSRDLVHRAGEPGAAVTIGGTLEFQACDDKVCFLPESVPVTLTLGLRPFESQ